MKMNIVSCLTCWNAPIAPTEIQLCGMCFEPGGSKRKCCNAVFCDHCYTKNKACPNCKQSTRQEKMTGATYTVTVFSEHEECRICLDPGLKRRCCANYYCDDCYYNQPNCRSCGTPVGRKGKGFGFSRATFIAIFLGWMVTLFIAGAVTGLVLILINSELRTPVGMSGYKCYGFFQSCHVRPCIDLDDSIAVGTSTFPPLNQWQFCSLNSTTKMRSQACVFDQQLFTSTAQHAGYDVCADEFQNGVYIFEDRFENWDEYDNFTTNMMKSAFWNFIYNGFTSNVCSVPSGGGSNSLVFGGEMFRYAETKDLNVSTGGWVEAKMYISPIGNDIHNPGCKTNYNGAIELQYSINSGESWVLIKNFDPWIYRSDKYFSIKQEIPGAAKTVATRFRFFQPTFQQARDAWALDDVRVFKYIDRNWQSKPEFKKNVKVALKGIQYLQCCFDTDWCVNRLTAEEMQQCYQFPWYLGPDFVIRSAEICLMIATLINVLKFIYISIQTALIHKRFPFQDEYEDLTKIERLIKLLPPRYRPRKTLESYASNVHASARLEADMRNQFDDEEGDGQRLQRDEEKKAEIEKELKRIRKLKKKLAKRLKGEMDQSGVEEMQKLDAAEATKAAEAEAVAKQAEEGKDPTQFATDKFATDKDKFKRQNIALLRVAFNNKVDLKWRSNFFITTVGIFTVLYLYKLSTTTLYTLHQHVNPFGKYDGDIAINSLGINFFAGLCDFKELYYTLKFIVPARDEWVPLITLDMAETVNSLFVGPHIVKLTDVTEVAMFSPRFAYACAFAYFLGVVPWCTISLILRDQYMPFPVMRIVTPTFGAIMILRAILGAGFVVKMFFSLYYVMAIDFHVRERMGIAFQSQNTINTALNAAIMMAITGAFFCSAVDYHWAWMASLILLAFGFVFGGLVGFSHELPIRPWMCLTVLDGGTWLRVKKKHKCPCNYWGKFCTDMHRSAEVFVIYTTDDVKFTGMIQGSAGVGGQAV